MSITLDYLRKYDEIYITWRVEIETLSKFLEKKIDDVETAHDSKKHTMIYIDYYKIRGREEFEVSYNEERDSVMLIRTKVEKEMIDFLERINTLDHVLEDIEYYSYKK